MDDTSSPAPPAPKKGGGLLKKLLLAVLVLFIVGAGGAWWLVGAHKPTAAPSLETRGLVTFDPFLVNLTDAGGTRFLKVTLAIVVGSAAQAKEIQDAPVLVSQARSNILELLAQQSSTILVTPEGKDALKQAIKQRVTPVFDREQVLDVLFSEFVVQF